MGKILLRETYDKNLNEVIRLKGLESGQSILAVIKKGKKVPNIQSLASPIFAHICVTDQCNYCGSSADTMQAPQCTQVLRTPVSQSNIIK